MTGESVTWDAILTLAHRMRSAHQEAGLVGPIQEIRVTRRERFDLLASIPIDIMPAARRNGVFDLPPAIFGVPLVVACGRCDGHGRLHGVDPLDDPCGECGGTGLDPAEQATETLKDDTTVS